VQTKRKFSKNLANLVVGQDSVGFSERATEALFVGLSVYLVKKFVLEYIATRVNSQADHHLAWRHAHRFQEAYCAVL
jgi:hypothetical protein